MKHLLLSLGLFIAATASYAQKDTIVMEVGKVKVPKSEFLQIYLKNNPHPKFDQKTLDDYADMFAKFKLKVIEAEAEGYDTIPKLERELAGYRNTLSAPYLTDKTLQEDLVKQAYDRLKTEVRASHILIKVSPRATPEDTLRAYNKILAIKKRIEAGEDFEKVAKETSEDPSVAHNGGDLGYFTAFQMVYPFEEAAYTTKLGKVSNIVRTNYGYHILEVTGIRPERGTIRVAHIMIAAKEGSTPAELASAKKKAEEIYQKAIKGEDFAKLAKDYSDDSQSAQRGGELPAFGSGTTTRMVPTFEDAAFALKHDGDISEPVQTDFGFHIIKRLEWKPLGSFDELKREIQEKVSKDERAKITQAAYIVKLKKEYNFKDESAKGLKWFYANVDSSYFKGQINLNKIKKDRTLFVLNKIPYTQKQFGAYLNANNRYVRTGTFKEIVDKNFKNWEENSVIDYEKSQLDTKYPEFKSLMNEYHDGVLLFEIMSNKVWNKASEDSVGLKKFFDENRSKYVWKKRLDAYVYECQNKKVASEVYAMLEKNDTISSKTIIDKINKDSELNLKVMTNKYEQDNTPYLKDRDLKESLNSVYDFDGKYYVVKVNEILPPSEKEFAQCRGLVISDYQDYLEKVWITQLKQKYPVKVHEQVLYHINDK